ncbi:MAG TPA: 30S ribosomal protein S17 [Anaerolineaceae bacterium]|nr:30S ribosomal protein S17 [Anaerolineaceae bacterium]
MNQRRRLTGIVTSNKMMKTVVVEVARTYKHPLYHKVVHARQKIKAHDELGCAIGDKVMVVECSPISKEKTWMVQSVIKREGKTLDVAEEAVE